MNEQSLVFLLRLFWILIFLNEMFGYVATWRNVHYVFMVCAL